MSIHGTAPAPSDRELLLEIRDNQRTTSTKLFGSPEADEENETGRLPKVERAAKTAHQRLDTMEGRMERLLRRAVYAGVSGTIATILAAADLYSKVKK